jgi:hypothetical protein
LVFATPSPTKLVGRAEHRRAKWEKSPWRKGDSSSKSKIEEMGRSFSTKKEIPSDRFVRNELERPSDIGNKSSGLESRDYLRVSCGSNKEAKGFVLYISIFIYYFSEM